MFIEARGRELYWLPREERAMAFAATGVVLEAGRRHPIHGVIVGAYDLHYVAHGVWLLWGRSCALQ